MSRIASMGGVLLLLGFGGGVAPESSQTCRPVPHAQLEALLPVVPGFTRGQAAGETDNQEAVSRVTVDCESGAATISVEFMDTCRNADMLSQLREWLKGGAPRTRGTVVRTLQVRGFPAYEEWTAETQHSEIHVLVADRFTVKVTGDLVNLPPVQTAAQAIDLQKMATLK